MKKFDWFRLSIRQLVIRIYFTIMLFVISFGLIYASFNSSENNAKPALFFGVVILILNLIGNIGSLLFTYLNVEVNTLDYINESEHVFGIIIMSIVMAVVLGLVITHLVFKG